MNYQEIQNLRRSGVQDSDIMTDLASRDSGFAEIVQNYKESYPNPDPFLQVKAPTYLINKYYNGKFTNSKQSPTQKKTAEKVSQMAMEQKAKTEEQSWLSWIGQGIATGYDYATSPIGAATGAAIKGLGNLTGRKLNDQAEAEYRQDLEQAPTAIRAGVPILAGIGTAGASIPASMAVSGLAGAGSSLLASGVEAAAGEDVSVGGAVKDAATTGLASAAIDGVTMGLAKPVASLLRAGGVLKPSAKVVQELVQPKATAKLIQETAQTAPNLVKKGGMLRAGGILPSLPEKNLAKTAKTIAGFGKTADPVSNMNILSQAIRTEAKALKSSLQVSDAALPRKQILGALKSAQKEAVDAFGNEQTAVRQYQGILNVWEKISSRFPGTTSGQWAARIEFDNELERQFGKKVFDATLERPIHAAVRTVREVVNSQIDTAATAAGRSFLPQIKRMSDMYNILENISTKVGPDTLKSGLGKVMGTRTAKGVAAGVLGTLGAGAVLDSSQ